MLRRHGPARHGRRRKFRRAVGEQSPGRAGRVPARARNGPGCAAAAVFRQNPPDPPKYAAHKAVLRPLKKSPGTGAQANRRLRNKPATGRPRAGPVFRRPPGSAVGRFRRRWPPGPQRAAGSSAARLPAHDDGPGSAAANETGPHRQHDVAPPRAGPGSAARQRDRARRLRRRLAAHDPPPPVPPPLAGPGSAARQRDRARRFRRWPPGPQRAAARLPAAGPGPVAPPPTRARRAGPVPITAAANEGPPGRAGSNHRRRQIRLRQNPVSITSPAGQNRPD